MPRQQAGPNDQARRQVTVEPAPAQPMTSDARLRGGEHRPLDEVCLLPPSRAPGPELCSSQRKDADESPKSAEARAGVLLSREPAVLLMWSVQVAREDRSAARIRRDFYEGMFADMDRSARVKASSPGACRGLGFPLRNI
ncbi:hypothetical protein ED733_003063 [Metarhizium rileyi]|uniref:Uncharacterized protein n=1 Tax=Metarhizium rileyi (strain RCEF 4871) TaxID=1649241 RepID=A0A5C6G233_METRR|nr:hypothetical protein ED733_003063 [Metarhizium rileyi]